jgi:hypothetical protein
MVDNLLSGKAINDGVEKVRWKIGD